MRRWALSRKGSAEIAASPASSGTRTAAQRATPGIASRSRPRSSEPSSPFRAGAVLASARNALSRLFHPALGLRGECDEVVNELAACFEWHSDDVGRVSRDVERLAPRAWMNLHQRNFFPREFETDSLRPWDNFFY